jgi:cellulose synthase/poly-beta-1,6-N-acetylglucosamine synthase-like glycosyltransferase
MPRISLLLFTVFISSFLNAQTTRLVKGRIIDQKTERAVEEVEIKLQNTKTKKSYIVETTEDGDFEFKNIPYGNYNLLAGDKDYEKKTLNNFTLTEEHKDNYTFDVKRPFSISLKVTWMFNWGNFKGKEHYWSHLIAKIILTIYGICLFLIFFYSILQLSLSIAYSRNKKKKENEIKPVYNPETTPKVTIQLPMYNEMYVAERIIEQISQFEYPRDKFQIQVLDDSTDETKDIITKKVAEVAERGLNIQHVHRVDRTGYKAGALDAAMNQVEGEFIGIFDSDFMPEKDFLQRTMPYFADPKIGVVQTRWGHINKNYSILTELQAFGLNGHFAIEQGGRTASGHFINFNGTAGIWRKQCIADAGGWEHDTLTEDLDLSYRAQIFGWKFKYCEDIIAPAELPVTMSALKNQQHRWMKGGAECFIKMWKRLLTAKNVKFMDRVHGLSHLFNSSLFLFILTLSLLSLPILHIKDSFSDLNFFIQFGSIFISSTIFLMYFYWLSFRDKSGKTFKDLIKFIGRFFQFLIISMGLSLSNTVAVIEGYLGIKSSFVRTPKFNVLKKGDLKNNKYDKKSLSIINIGEGILMCVFAFTAINRALFGDLGMVPFHLMLSIGYGAVFFYTIAEIRESNK